MLKKFMVLTALPLLDVLFVKVIEKLTKSQRATNNLEKNIKKYECLKTICDQIMTLIRQQVSNSSTSR